MDTFNIIQNFFTRMACQFCEARFEPDDVHLVGEGEGYMVVSVYCHGCGQHNGVAAVGVETREIYEDAISVEERYYPDPEFTDEDRQRLGELPPISEEDVLGAHQFIRQLDGNWTRFIPEEIRERYTGIDTESQPES